MDGVRLASGIGSFDPQVDSGLAGLAFQGFMDYLASDWAETVLSELRNLG